MEKGYNFRAFTMFIFTKDHSYALLLISTGALSEPGWQSEGHVLGRMGRILMDWVGADLFCFLWYGEVCVAWVSGFKGQWSYLIKLSFTTWAGGLNRHGIKNLWIDDNAKGTSTREKTKDHAHAKLLVSYIKGQKKTMTIFSEIITKKTIWNVDIQPHH